MKYRCLICGEIVDVQEGEDCPICGADCTQLELVEDDKKENN